MQTTYRFFLTLVFIGFLPSLAFSKDWNSVETNLCCTLAEDWSKKDLHSIPLYDSYTTGPCSNQVEIVGKNIIATIEGRGYDQRTQLVQFQIEDIKNNLSVFGEVLVNTGGPNVTLASGRNPQDIAYELTCSVVHL